jgi:hypothetical protein
MPDNYVQDPFNSQSFNRYGYVLNNPLRYTDPTGELSQREFDEVVTTLWNRPNGGTWSADGGYHFFGSQGEAFAWGVGYMNQTGGWGGGGGTWASSPGAALNSYLASGASGGGLWYSYSNESGSGVFRTDTYHGSSYFDGEMGEGYNLIGIGAGEFNVDFGNSTSSEGWLGWVQTGLDILGSTEIPIVSQLADLGSAGISFAQGDNAGGMMSLGGMFVPGLSQTKLGLKFAKTGQTIIGEGMKRVSIEAAKRPGSVILDNMPTFTGTADQITSQMMTYNRQWILQQMRSRRPILDIGLDPNRGVPSIFYQMEQNMVKNYLKLHPNAFQVIKP